MAKNGAMVAVIFLLAFASSSPAAWLNGEGAFSKELDPDFIDKLFGPTNINGIVGNGGIAAAFSRQGEMTVLRWPTPGTFDQVRYLTLRRDLPLMGAAPNMGVFIGLAPARGPVQWVRDHQVVDQSYLHEKSAVLRTERIMADLGLVVTTRDFAHPEKDLLVRLVHVRRLKHGPRRATLVWFENLAPCATRIPYAPLSDWLFETLHDQHVRFSEPDGALIHFGDENRVYLSLAADRPPQSFQVGPDDPACADPADAFCDAADGSLSGNPHHDGQSTGALGFALDLTSGDAGIALFIGAADNQYQALETIRWAKNRGADLLLADTEAFWKTYLAGARVPDTDDERMRSLFLRTLISTRQTTSESGAFMASISTQPPYGQDWPRDGSYVNACLDAAGLHEMVTRHLEFYAALASPVLGIYDMAYYPDGVPAGPLFFEIDAASLVQWSLAHHYFELPAGDSRDAYWETVAPAMRRTVDFMCAWRDPTTGLPLPAFESDFVVPASTLLAASNVFLAADWAARAWEAAGEDAAVAEEWILCREELRQGILDHYVQDDRFVGDIFAKAALVWPGEFLEPGDPLLDPLLEELYDYAESCLYMENPVAGYEGLLTYSLAKQWKDDEQKRARVEKLLIPYVYDVPTPKTQHYGEVHVVRADEYGIDRFENHTGIPHQETPCLVFLTAAELYGTRPVGDDDDDDSAPPGDDDTENGDDDPSTSSEEADDEDCCGC